jgi:histidinol-phosphate aminotransferase
VPLDSEGDVNRLYNDLLHRGIIIRPLKAFGLPQCVRITIGTESENSALIQALQSIRERVNVG